MVKKHTWSLDSRAAKVYLQNLLENIPDAIYFKDKESRFLLSNEACLRKHGFKKLDECIGKTDADVFSEEHAKQALKDEQLIITTGKPVVGIEEMETWPDGHVTWVSTTKMPLVDNNGEIVGTFGISRDITERKLADLRAAEYAAEISRFKEAMEAEVRMAGELQKAFFPKSYPVFPPKASARNSRVEMAHIAESSGIVGGDLCSIKRISQSEVGIFLCDVMGHGVRAALGTAIIRSLIEELTPLESEPDAFLAHMNERVYPIFQHSKDVMFITALYLVLDTTNGRIRYASAGHPVPMHYSKAKKTTQRPQGSLQNAALALFKDSQYNPAFLHLDQGDTVLLFTDGIYEASNDMNQQLGRKRLAQIFANQAELKIPEMLATVLDDVKAFSIGKTLEDDVCLVGLRWKGPGAIPSENEG